MSSSESDRSDSQRQTSWSSSNYSFSDSMPSSVSRDYSTGSSLRSAESFTNSTSFDNYANVHLELPELTQVPWTEGDVLSVLQKGKFRDCCGSLSIECLQRLTYLLQRPLVRIAREAQRFSQVYNKCCKHDIIAACKLTLSPHLFDASHKLASQSALLYSMSTVDTNANKSSMCSLSVSIGKHHRWLLEALAVGYIHELASVYLAATMESIIEETACLAFLQDGSIAGNKPFLYFFDLVC